MPSGERPPRPARPEFAVIGARPLSYAARADVNARPAGLASTSGRQVYMVALTIQLMIEPARRAYDDATRERLVDLFGPPERWAVPPAAWCGPSSTCSCRRSSARRRSRSRSPCSYDLEVAAAKYLHALPDGEAPLALHFNGMIYYPGDDGGPADGADPVVELDRLSACRCRCGSETIEHYYPGHRLGGACAARRSRRWSGRSWSAGWPTLDACAERAARAMADHLEQLRRVAAVGGLRAVPVHPGRDQERHPDAVRDRLPAGLRGRLRGDVRPRSSCAARSRPEPDATLEAEVRFLAPRGERHQARASGASSLGRWRWASAVAERDARAAGALDAALGGARRAGCATLRCAAAGREPHGLRRAGSTGPARWPAR